MYREQQIALFIGLCLMIVGVTVLLNTRTESGCRQGVALIERLHVAGDVNCADRTITLPFAEVEEILYEVGR